jgi:hypothetical protein
MSSKKASQKRKANEGAEDEDKKKKSKVEEALKIKARYAAAKDKIKAGEVVLINRSLCVLYELNTRHSILNDDEWNALNNENNNNNKAQHQYVRCVSALTLHQGIAEPIQYDNITPLSSTPYSCYLSPNERNEAIEKHR